MLTRPSNTINGLAPDADSEAIAGKAGAAARAGAAGTPQRVEAGMSNAKSAIARGQGNPTSTFAGGRDRVEGNYASNSGAVKGYGIERGSNMGAEEFSKVERKRDQADAQRQEMRDKADKQGGAAIDNMLGFKKYPDGGSEPPPVENPMP